MIIDLRKKHTKPKIKFDEFGGNCLIIGNRIDEVSLWGLTAIKQLKLSSHTSAVYAVNFFPPSTEEDPIYGQRKKYVKRLKALLKEAKGAREEDTRKMYIIILGADQVKRDTKGYEEMLSLSELGSKGYLHVIALSLNNLNVEFEKYFKDRII